MEQQAEKPAAPTSAAAVHPEPVQQETTGGGGSSGPPDSLVIHPYLYAAALKVPVAGKQQKELEKLASGREGKQYAAALAAARAEFATVLESPTIGDAAAADAATKYLGLLLGLVNSYKAGVDGAAPAAAAGAAADSPDAALAAAEAGAGASPSAAPASKLRFAARWEWGDGALFAPPPGAQPRRASSSDAAFELGSSLVAYACRLMHVAGQAAADSASGVATPATTRAYNLLRQAAGVLEAAAREALPSLAAGTSTDLDLQAVRGVATLALADAQSLSLLRAVQKGNAPDLISAIAVDTQALYAQAAAQIGSAAVPGARESKLVAYCSYKQAYCAAYAHCFNGISLWKKDRPGDGLKSLEVAAAALAGARRSSADYDAAPPASLNLHHRRVDEVLERVLADSQARMQRENDSVHMQRVATEVPALPEGKRLVAATPYALPPPAREVREGVVDTGFGEGPPPPTQAPRVMEMEAGGAAAAGGAADGKAEGEGGGCSCCRWLVYVVTAPFLLFLWLLGAVLWLILLPLKCCCPCLGVPLGWATSAMMKLMRLPFKCLRWIAGSPWEDEGEEEEKKKKKEEKK